MKILQMVIFLVCLLVISACSTGEAAPNTSSPTYKTVLIEDVPHVKQKPDFCGEACAEMYLKKLGKQMDQDYVFNQSGLSPELGRGCFTREFTNTLYRMGFQVGRTWYLVPAENTKETEAQFARLHADLVAGIPSIICMHYDDKPKTTEHFRLILGYDAETDEVIYHEPAVTDGGYNRMKRTMLLGLWPLKYDARRWTVVRIRLEPGRLVEGRPSRGITNADYTQHILALKEGLPSEDFHIILQRPFVVIGDESPATVRQRSTQTVQWAVNRIKRDYFSKDPDEIIDIWLFKDEESYEENAKELFGSKPDTPFGYYSPRHKSLVMNISTGGGTLVHEIVHPFMRANFSECPSWFNEGLASLYEQCRDYNGHIWGNTNWRLTGLQEAIIDDTVPSFEELCATTTHEFYDEDPGTNYSQARYLCYYLQQHGLLIKYYHEFRRNAEDDPTGYKTLVKILGDPDMDEFKRKWQEYVTRLRI